MNITQLEQLLGGEVMDAIDMPVDEAGREVFIAELMEVFFQRLIVTVSDKLDSENSTKLKEMFDTSAPIEDILKFVSTNCDDFTQIVSAELAQFRTDLVGLSSESSEFIEDVE